ncbi:SAM dependent carboxyl methyltransferase [Artemisia annua]|uniref:SAM dependent carboxyl methyltransferase n=1 Tax=Artemisia annua TaxID=35608 RepID=A0A2U1NHP7_ARTAN|nr:SAM dependent carboxyl methyltransferase [Artemisia annua]
MASQEPAAMQLADMRMNTYYCPSWDFNPKLVDGSLNMGAMFLNYFCKISNIHYVFIALNAPHYQQCYNIADLRCSWGSNTLLAISNIIHEMHEVSKEKNLKPPQLQVCLNNLFGNDFNSVFKSLPPMFYANYNKEGENIECYV